MVTQAEWVLAWIVVTTSLGRLLRRWQRREEQRREARQRRIGWNYGYGAGWVDAANGVYRPGAPEDGRTRTNTQRET